MFGCSLLYSANECMERFENGEFIRSCHFAVMLARCIKTCILLL